jgi:hypothetical protein
MNARLDAELWVVLRADSIAPLHELRGGSEPVTRDAASQVLS